MAEQPADAAQRARQRLADLLDEVALATTGSGSLAAVALALAAVVTGTAARQAGFGGFDAQADSLRRRAVVLAVTDAEAFADALMALHPEQHGLEATGDEGMQAALGHGVDVLTELVVLANDVAQLSAAVAEGAEGDFRADAVASSMLATAAADIAAHLVSETLLVGPDDDRLARVRVVASHAAEATRRVARHRQ